MTSPTVCCEATEPFSAGRWALLVPHRHRLLRLTRRRVLSPHDAEDCVHETLLRAAAFPTLDETRVGQFLTATAMRLCVDGHRAHTRARRAMARIHPEVTEPPEGLICDQAEGEWLMAKVHTFSDRERDVLLARAAGLTTRQAATYLDISPKSAESAFTRGRGHLIDLHRHQT